MKFRRKVHIVLLILVLLFLLLFSVILSLSIGELNIQLIDLWRIIFNPSEMDQTANTLLLQLRLPRVILGLSVGGGLSLAGVLLQGIYRNPLVEPYTMGISGGASLGVATVIVLGFQSAFAGLLLPLSGFIGAMLTIVLVYGISVRNGNLNINRMLLTGVMLSFISSSLLMFFMAITSSENLQGIIYWIMGSLDQQNNFLVYLTLISNILVLLISFIFIKSLNALRIGKDSAMHLGVNTDRVIKGLFILASLLAGICVSVAGVIGFVGLIIPHILRLILGHDYRILLIASFLCGGSFLILSDLVARTIISPNELPVGVITGIIGGTLFIILMSRKWRTS